MEVTQPRADTAFGKIDVFVKTLRFDFVFLLRTSANRASSFALGLASVLGSRVGSGSGFDTADYRYTIRTIAEHYPNDSRTLSER